MEKPSTKITPLWIEQVYPWVIGSFVFGLAVGAHFSGIRLPSSENFFSAVVSLGGVFTGFMATLKAMLSSIDAKTFKRLRDSGYLQDLVNYLSTALWGGLSLCSLSIIGFFGFGNNYILCSMILGTVSFVLTSVHRVATIATSLLLARQE